MVGRRAMVGSMALDSDSLRLLPGCVTLGKLPGLSGLRFFLCEEDVL